MALTKYKDITGQQFGKLVVVSRAATGTKTRAAKWLCKCECGGEKIAEGGNLRIGNTQSCGCLQHKDITGRKFGRLTVIGVVGRHKGRVTWQCKCDCGRETEAVSSWLLSGNTKSCGCLQDEHRRRISQSGADANKVPKQQKGITTFYHGYKKQAIDRRLDFELSKEEFNAIVTQPCHYCGGRDEKFVSTKEFGSIEVNGIDRVDSTIGYIPGNCVPCCKFCNYAKRSVSIDEFRERIIKIYNHFIK